MSPFQKSEDKGDAVEHLQVGLSEFMAQKEGQVRRVIDSFNKVMGTEFTTTLECNEFGEMYKGAYSMMVQDMKMAWESFLALNQIHWTEALIKKMQRTWMIGLGVATVVGGAIGYAIGHGF